MSAARISKLVRELRYGEQLSFDGGRIVVQVEERSGRRVGLRLTLHEAVVVDKPGAAANDARAGAKGP
ncbi:MAG: hypothetical protein J7556_22210 [Acidovorax sp.]|nr:hypothetical protein [Acidovorax sp.]